MQMKNQFADVGDRVALQCGDDVSEGCVVDWRESNALEGYDLLVDWDNGTSSYVRGFLLLRINDPQQIAAAA